MLKLNTMYGGTTILNHAQEMGNKISVDGIFVRVPLHRIDKNGVYSFAKNDRGGITICHHNDSWSCDPAVFNHIQTEGTRVLDNIFGDLLDGGIIK